MYLLSELQTYRQLYLKKLVTIKMRKIQLRDKKTLKVMEFSILGGLLDCHSFFEKKNCFFP